MFELSRNFICSNSLFAQLFCVHTKRKDGVVNILKYFAYILLQMGDVNMKKGSKELRDPGRLV